MNNILIALFFLVGTTNVYALDIVYRFLTISVPNEEVRLVGDTGQGVFQINGIRGANGKDKFEMVFANDFESFCPKLASRNPNSALDCTQKDRIAVLDRISTEPALQRFFGVVNDIPQIFRQETVDYVLYSAIGGKPMVEGVTSVIIVKHNSDTVLINGFYTKKHLEMLHVSDWIQQK